jgi:N-acetylneuraminate synthase
MNINKNKYITVIAEIGINHNGDINLAKKLMLLAKECGCDLVKFQKRDVLITTPVNIRNNLRNTPWGQMTYLEYKKKLEFNKKEFDQIDAYSKKINIGWFASPWDINSLNFLKNYNLKYYKIASAMITNIPLLKLVSLNKKKTFISTGMCKLNDIAVAVKIFRKNKCPFELMHSVSSYPANEVDLNLSMIPKLKKIFKCNVGYSGHEATVSPSVGACYLGATSIERHITLDRTMWGTDQAASLSKRGLEELVSMVKKIPLVIGNGKKKLLKTEIEKAKSLRYW